MAKNANTITEGRGLKKPLCFVENKGEVVDENSRPRNDIHYKLSTPGMSMYVGAGQLHYQFAKAEGTHSSISKVTTYRMDVVLEGANPNAKPEASGKQDYYENYYLNGYTGAGFTANSWSKVTYRDIYPNIDWVLYVKNGEVEYDFNVRPGGNVSDIKLTYGGATSLKINSDGSLSAKTPMGSVTEKTPFAYEANSGKQVAANFKLKGNTVTFETGNYNDGIVIDPALLWSTYYGGAGLEVATCVAIAPGSGNTYVGGFTSSNPLTTAGTPFMSAYQGGTSDAFMARYSPAGVLQYATYIGGAGTDRGLAIAIESLGANMYLAGSTTSNPAVGVLSTFGAYHTTNLGGVDGFLIKFNSAGARQWCTFYGGAGTDSITCVAVDGSNNVIVGGQTNSTTNIASSAGVYQPARNGANDAFLAKFNSAGTIQWSTYYGGTSTDAAMGVTTNPAGNIFVTGQTSSVTDMATSTSFQPTLRGTNDAFIAMFDGAGTRTWGTYFGGTGAETSNNVACDPVSGALAIAGNTTSVNFIASANAHQATFGGIQDAYIASFDQTGNRLWSTYFGGSQFDYGEDVCFDLESNVVAAGGTFSAAGISSTGSSQPAIGGDYDVFVAKMNPLGQRVWGTYFGGSFYDYATGIAIDRSFSPGQMVVSGHTTSIGTYGSGGIITSGAAQPAYGGGVYDAFISKFVVDLYATLDQPFTDTLVCAGGTLQVPYSIYPATATFLAGNIFSVELSDITGSFASPTVIGSAAATTSGIITCTIPGGTPVGIGYKIRLVSTNPIYVSPDNYYSIRVVATLGGTTAFSNSPVCVSNTLNLNDTATYTIMSWNWSGPAGFTSTLQNPSIPLVTMANAGVYSVTTVHNGCPASTATTTVVVNNVIPPTPVISASNGCAGFTLTLFSNPDTVTTDPIYYSWVGPAGFSSTMQNPTIPGTTVANTGYYFVHTILNGCASADTFVYVTVNPVIPVSVSIAANSPYIPGSPGDTICAGDLVTFNAFPINGGSTPSFQWHTGIGAPVVGAISNSWSTTSLLEGQGVFVTLSSSVLCPSPVIATSNTIKMNVISNTPTVYIAASPGLHVTPGTNITFTSYVYNGGIGPTYQWTKNGVVIPGATNPTYTLVGVTKMDTIALTVTSTMACVPSPINTSNKLVVMTNVGVSGLSAALDDISLFPNPNNGTFAVKGTLESAGMVSLEVTNMLGQVIYTNNFPVQNNVLDHTIELPKTASGIYLLRVNKDGDNKIFRFVVER
jgi:hypothetical protein